MNGQNPVFESPFCARCQVVRADHGAVDHLDAVWRCTAIVEGIEHQFPKSGQGPAPELAIHARPLAELFRQITPGSTGSSNPENAIENKAVVGGRATALPRIAIKKGSKNAHSVSSISNRAKITSAKAILNHNSARL